MWFRFRTHLTNSRKEFYVIKARCSSTFIFSSRFIRIWWFYNWRVSISSSTWYAYWRWIWSFYFYYLSIWWSFIEECSYGEFLCHSFLQSCVSYSLLPKFGLDRWCILLISNLCHRSSTMATSKIRQLQLLVWVSLNDNRHIPSKQPIRVRKQGWSNYSALNEWSIALQQKRMCKKRICNNKSELIS